MARGERAGVEAAAPSRGRRRELRRLAPPRAPGASGFAAALRPVPLREACAFVPFEAFAAARAGAAEVCGSGEARARRRREGRARRQRVRSRVTTRRAEARRGGPRLGGARERSRVRVDRKKRWAREGGGSARRSGAARVATHRSARGHGTEPRHGARFPCFPGPLPGFAAGREASCASLRARSAGNGDASARPSIIFGSRRTTSGSRVIPRRRSDDRHEPSTFGEYARSTFRRLRFRWMRALSHSYD